MKPELITCVFTSIWSEGSEITTPCTYDPKTREVFPELSDSADPDGYLEREYITLSNEDELNVCTNCHRYVLIPVVGDLADCHGNVLIPVVGDLADCSYGECPNPDCEE
jgi:hypothetical protein